MNDILKKEYQTPQADILVLQTEGALLTASGEGTADPFSIDNELKW